ncbi:hypothetical protein [Cytobacillus purgationiresistens]|uniref:Transposase n=1 Tax=Cytobacillus purgationiresistens TaxID=863449 RepID=A0ABU0AQI9_9BACI|nr:hypothetical protein [Cytobacillus purgationiresistens]MDQ0273538.1 hypothetical protein [Cytobacillus purgationiresistens]
MEHDSGEKPAIYVLIATLEHDSGKKPVIYVLIAILVIQVKNLQYMF